MTKEEKIKESWGITSDKINEKGWLYFGYACNGWDDVEDWLEDNNLNSDESYYDMTYDECDNGDLIYVQIRPKSLQGIENNNGWIKIESEEQRFPDEDLWICNFNGNKQPFIHDAYDFIPERYTHYQPIEKPKPPLF